MLQYQTGKRYADLMVHFCGAEAALRKTGVTKKLLWAEYSQEHADHYNYSQYCYYLQIYLNQHDLVMHLQYNPGDMIMVDFAGKKLSYVVVDTGEVIDCQIFVAILPHSGLIYCKAVESQQTADFVRCINGMLDFYGGVPITLLCDNLKTAVIRPDRYEPIFTEVCHQLSAHYLTTFSATRPYSPRDKAMVEGAVKIVYMNIYAPLRKKIFHSLRELNMAMHTLLEVLNNKPYKNSSQSRRQLFTMYEQGCLSALPADIFRLKKIVQLTLQRNYCIRLQEDGVYYSAPYGFVGKKVRVLYDNYTLEIYFDYGRIAEHDRKPDGKLYKIRPEHMPPAHKHMLEIKGWTKEELLDKAAQVGPYTRQAADRILGSSISIQQNFKACHGMILLQHKYTKERLEAACRRAVTGSVKVYLNMIRNILTKGLDKQPLLFDEEGLPKHENIRGNYR
jgi:transposase